MIRLLLARALRRAADRLDPIPQSVTVTLTPADDVQPAAWLGQYERAGKSAMGNN